MRTGRTQWTIQLPGVVTGYAEVANDDKLGVGQQELVERVTELVGE